MDERMVQVPVSLIERMKWHMEHEQLELLDETVEEVVALLSQPTPTAERYPDCPKYPHQAIDCPGDDMDVDHDPSRPADPPRIEDMAPGTITSICPRCGGSGCVGLADCRLCAGTGVVSNPIPSTIRDVRPPANG